MPNGRRYVYYRNADPGRSSQLDTDRDLQLGPAPSKIPRTFDENIHGIIDDGNYNFDNPMDTAPLPFIRIGKQITAPSRAGIPAFTETASVRAFSAGDNLTIINR